MEGAPLRPRSRDGNQSLQRLHKSADHIVAKRGLAVDAHALTYRNDTSVLVLSVLLNERDWFLKWFRGSIKRHALNLIHNHETNTAIRRDMGSPCFCLNAVLWLSALSLNHFLLPCLLSALFTRHFPSGGGPRGGWLSMSPSDSRGAAFTLSKRGEPSLLISPRTAQSRVVVGLWKPLLSRWVSTLSPPLTLILPPSHPATTLPFHST